MSQNKFLSIPDPEYASILKGLRPFVREDDLVSIRALEDAIPQEPFVDRLPAPEELRVADHQIPVEGGEITVRTMVPTHAGDATKTFPVFVWYHGGGFAWGGLKLDDYRLRILCVELKIVVVNVDYRLAPEHPFPVPWDDGFAAAKWVAANASLLSASPEKGFIVGGSSAGGLLATTVAHRARDDPAFSKTPITGQLLQCSPVLHPETSYAGYEEELLSLEELKDDPILSKASIVQYARWSGAPATAEGWSVIKRNHSGLAPVYAQIPGIDPTRDEQLLYAKLLQEAGVKTKVITYPGVPHAFNYFFLQLSAAPKFESDMREGLRWLLSLTKA